MSQNLTQPEEIDHILRTMASRGLSIDALLADEYYSGVTGQTVNRDVPSTASVICCCPEKAGLPRQ